MKSQNSVHQHLDALSCCDILLKKNVATTSAYLDADALSCSDIHLPEDEIEQLYARC